MERGAPLPEPWSPEDAESIGRWGHPDATYEPLLLVRCLQRHPRLAARTRALGEGLYVDGRLPARLRTLAILRACALLGCAYEWGGQAAFWGPIAGVGEEDCDALVTGGPDDPRWGARQRVPLSARHELEGGGARSDAHRGALRDEPARERPL